MINSDTHVATVEMELFMAATLFHRLRDELRDKERALEREFHGLKPSDPDPSVRFLLQHRHRWETSDQRRQFQQLEREALARYEKFVGFSTGTDNLNSAFVRSVERIRKGRAGVLDEIDSRQREIVQRYTRARDRYDRLARGEDPDAPPGATAAAGEEPRVGGALSLRDEGTPSKPFKAHIEQRFSAALTGFQVPGPATTGLTASYEQAGAAALQSLDAAPGVTFPKVQAGPDGKFAVADRGWMGGAWWSGAPGGAGGEFRIEEHFVQRPGEQRIELAKPGATPAQAAFWWLKILDPVVAAAEPAPPATGELAGFGVWPGENDPVRMRVGEEQEFEAVGVFLENVYDVAHLGDQSNWDASPEMQATGPRTFRATRPGTYSVRARYRNRGRLFETTVKVIVEP